MNHAKIQRQADYSEKTHLRFDVVETHVVPLRMGPGTGRTFGSIVDEQIGRALENGQRIASFGLTINPEDWESMVDTGNMDCRES